MSIATLADHAVTSAGVAWPSYGLWWADVGSPEPAELEGRQALTIAGTEFSGTVTSGGVFNGRAAYRLVAGAGGVSKPLPKKGYVNSAGVALATVLGDAARAAGETLVTTGITKRLGPNYAREEGATLGDLLQRHFPRQWYADADGTIRIGTRESTTYEGTAPRTRVDPAGAVIDLAVDSLEGLAPGVVVDGQAPATDLQIDLTPERLTVRVYAGRSARRLTALQRIVQAFTAHLAYAGVWEYRLINALAGKANLQPARVASGMPDLRNVPVRQGVYGLIDMIPPGELVLVCFADRDPSRPQVFARGSTADPTWIPVQVGLPVALGPGPANPISTMLRAI